MKICWDNLENVRLTKKSNFRDVVKNKTFYLKVCEKCGEEFLGSREHKFCCGSCSKRGENSPMYGKHHTEESKKKISEGNSGKHHTEESKKKISEAMKGENHPMYGRTGENHIRYGKHHTEETKRKMSEAQKEEKSYAWKGGVKKKNLPLYDTYAPQIGWIESVRRNETDPNILEVKCTHCGRWYIPSGTSVKNRLKYLNECKNVRGEHRFYCSKECKNSCPLYGKSANTLMKEDAIRAGRLPWIELEREVQPELREMVLERDGYSCVKCGATEKLCCHHILPVAIEPLESADVDNCITLCENCHKEVHKLPGCGYGEIRMEICQ